MNDSTNAIEAKNMKLIHTVKSYHNVETVAGALQAGILASTDTRFHRSQYYFRKAGLNELEAYHAYQRISGAYCK